MIKIQFTEEENDTSLSIEPLETKRIEVTQFLATADDTPRSLAVKHTLKPQREKNQPLQIKFLESTVNANGEVFTIGSKIQVIRSTFGNYNAIIEEIYQTADKVVWVKYSSFPSDTENPQYSGDCIALLFKICKNSSS